MRMIGVLAGCAMLVGCASGKSGSHGGSADGGVDAAGDGDAGVVLSGTLTIDQPGEQTLQDGAPAHVKLSATLTTADQKRYDVTPQTRFQVDPVYGAFDGSLLTISVAGKTRVTAAYGDQLATAEVTARAVSVRVDPSLATSTPDLFKHPDDPQSAAQIVYPPPGVIMPRNLGDFEIHWTDGTGHDVFELSLRTEFSDVRVYVPGGNGLATQGPMASWSAFRAGEWAAAVGRASAVSFQVRGVSAAGTGTVGATAPQLVRLSNETMDGGLYYWAAASVPGTIPATPIGIFRHDMARPGEPAEEYLTTNQTGGRCIACHVLSRDGKKMAITYQDPNPSGGLFPPGPATLVDVESKAIAPQSQRWNFATFTPDNTQLLSIDHGVLVVRDAVGQGVLATMPVTPAGTWVTHPDLSPDGTRLVYVRVGTTNTDFDFKTGQIYTRSYDAASHTFGAEVPLVNDGQNNFYPSWSPDGAWILFTKNQFGNAYDDNNSAVWVVKADGSHAPVELAQANRTRGLTNSWARWAPFPQTIGAGNEPIYWVTFSSKRSFGVRFDNAVRAQREKIAQIWMTPFFPGLATQGQDPSVPVFRLPFQNLGTSNHIAQWTEKVVKVIE